MKKLWKQYLEENKLRTGAIVAATVLGSSVVLYKGLVARGSKKRSAMAARIAFIQRSLNECRQSADPSVCIEKLEEEMQRLKLRYTKFLE